jgi:hypothetical protein
VKKTVAKLSLSLGLAEKNAANAAFRPNKCISLAKRHENYEHGDYPGKASHSDT